MDKRLFVFLAVMLIVIGCERKESASEKAAFDGEDIQQEDNSWGYEDKPVDLSKKNLEPPLEIEGGLVRKVGNLLEGEETRFKITLRSTGSEPWKLQEIVADCSCTNLDGIPGGIMMEPGKDRSMWVKVDASKIAPGNFEKHIYFNPLEYKPVVFKVTGRVEKFFECEPAGQRQMRFEAKGDPGAKWNTSLVIRGIGSAAGNLELAIDEDDKSASPYILSKITKIEDGAWKVEAEPVKILPYSGRFSAPVKIKVIKPEGYPSFAVNVTGKVGVPIVWRRSSVSLEEKDFVGGVAKLSFQLGFDPEDKNRKGRTRAMKQAEDVDWKKLFDALEVRMPEGCRYSKVFTRFGVRLDVEIPRSAMPEKGALKIESGCNGNWEGRTITVRMKRRPVKSEN